MRDWTLQYSLFWAASQKENTDCICPVDWEPYNGECRKISTLPTIQPPDFTALLLVTKTYAQYSQHGIKFFEPGFDIGGTGTYEWWGDDAIKFWKNTNLELDKGAMNRTGIWTETSASGQEIGFASCFNVPIEKTYLIGFGVDNWVSIRVDGVYVLDMEEIESANTFRYWTVYPVTIKKGIHVIEIIARNKSSIAAIGAEIYDATISQLKQVTNAAELEPYLLFSTKDLVGEYTNLGTNGYEILEDYALVLCDGNPPYYRKIEYTPCVYVEEIICNCTLSFDVHSNNLLSLLSVGNLLGGTCIFDAYLIDWYLDGEIAFSTGTAGSDPEIISTHPFTGEAAIPVIGGIYTPIVRWVEINGDILYSEENQLNDWCNDLDGLPSITTQSFNCSNGSTAQYSHSLTFDNIADDTVNMERTFQFDLSDNGLVTKFAILMTGYTVGDRFTISYVHIADEENPIVISDWIIGSSVTTDYTANPQQHGSGYSYLKAVIDLTQHLFSIGDYLLIQITPRVLDPTNNNNNWRLQMKCLEQFVCDYSVPNVYEIDVSTIAISYNSVYCRWELLYAHKAKYQYPDDWSYLPTGSYSYGASRTLDDPNTFQCTLSQKTSLSIYRINTDFTCVNFNAPLNIAKVGNILTLTFSDTNIYDKFKADYDALMIHSNWSNYSPDNTIPEHYKFFVLNFRIAPSCGDTSSYVGGKFHHNSIFIWDDVNHIVQITLINTTNGYPEIDCTEYEDAQGEIDLTQGFIDNPDYNHDTLCGYTIILFGEYAQYRLIAANTVNGRYAIGVKSDLMLDGCYPSEWIQQTAISMFGVLLTNIIWTITNMEDAANNFEVWNKLNPDGTTKETAILVYQIVDGIQLIP